MTALLVGSATGAETTDGTLRTDPSGVMGGRRAIADSVRCRAAPIEEVTVATLNNAPIVTAMANGHPVVLLLDTGAERTVFTPVVADRIGARPPRIEFQRRLSGLAGSLPSREVELTSFNIGKMPITWRRIVVAPVTSPRIFSIPLDGLLGADVLSAFDLDLDLPHNRLRFYEKGSCADGPPWLDPYTSIPTGRSRDEHLFFPIQLDGHRVIAIIDSGAQRTFVAASAARRLGISDQHLESDRPVITHSATAGQVNSRLHRFSELRVGSVLLRNPEFLVGNAVLKDCDVVLGADFLSSHRVWLSYGALKIFISSQ